MKKRKKLFTLIAMIGILLIPNTTYALTKSEVIYSSLDYTGKLKNSSVSNHLSFLEEKEEMDNTYLKDILNINGDESYQLDGNRIIWKNEGKDIFYKGTTDKLLPIEVKVDYYLNDEKADPKKIIGKKGTIKIHYQFTNKEVQTVRINNQNEVLYTPFAITLGTLFDGKENKDFQVTNGKVISTGTRNILISLACPGLYESTNLDSLKSFNEITITYKTTKFSLQNTYIVASPKLLEDKDFHLLEQVEDLYHSMNQLEENMQKLEDGSKSLTNGTINAYDGSKMLSTNMKSAHDAIYNLKNGSTSLQQGLTNLKNALMTIEGKLTENLEGQNITEIIANLNNLLQKNNLTIESIINQTGMNEEALKNIYITNNLQQYQPTDANDPLGKLKTAYELATLLHANCESLQITLTALSSFSQFNTLLEGVNNLENGSIKLTEGLNSLSYGSTQLYNGTIQLENGLKQLVEGSTSLQNGTEQFKKQGIDQLAIYSNKIKQYSNKIDALIQLGKDYKGFAANNSDTTMFVYTINK